MPFEKVDTQVDFPAQERAVLAFWEKTGAFDALRAQNKDGPRWSFLDGPITANNPMGVHHAWGRTYKDAFQRYHAMIGCHMRYQNGFDCQGLWVEVEVEKELKEKNVKLETKRDIENLVAGDTFASIDLFVNLCKQRVDKYARIQTEQSIRLGYWMDWDRSDADWSKPAGQRRSYFTMSEENNYTIWTFLKKCADAGHVYRGYDAMPWCPRCSVGLSQMEMAEGYVLVAHRAVFVRFPLRGRTGENLLVWTTTPWTLSSNVAAAVNPTLTYLQVKHHEQIYYVAKGAFTVQRLEEQFKKKTEWLEGVPKLKTLEQIFKEKGGYEIVGEVKGQDLVGLAYDGPFDDLPAQNHPSGFPAETARIVRRQNWAPDESARNLHRVVAWKDVGETEGTGIVHIAPGCGKEDFHLGKEQGLPPVAPLDEFGIFVPGFGPLEGKAAVESSTADLVLELLQKKSLLFAVEKYPHSYPHCWRCKTELLFRLVDEWFIGMSWRERIKKICADIQWIPTDGEKRELDWLNNMGDWMISKKRFWGLALPIWVDEATDDFEVIGSHEELKARAVEGWKEFEGHTPHRPWIDLIKIRNPKTGNLMSRIPDVGNPWLDAGIVPYSTMGYNTNRAEWAKWFPADFITESFPGQFRNWFYSLLAMSTMMEDRAPFKVLLGHALVRDQEGKEMHKTAGNSIPFEGAADTGYKLKNKQGVWEDHPPMSADLIRWMYCRHNPTQNINFGPIPADELRAQFELKLWNSYAFLVNYARLDGFDPTAAVIPLAQRPDLDRWILSDLQHLVAMARESFEHYELMTFCKEAERFIDDKLSNWYIRRSRKRFWKSEGTDDKQAAYQTLYTVMMTLTKLFAPIMPFLSETMYQNLRPGKDEAFSVHLCRYPEPDASQVDQELTEDMAALLDLVSRGSAARNSIKVPVRQPLAELKVQPGTDAERRALGRFADQLMEELNVKKVTLHEPSSGPLLRVEAKANMKSLGPKFGTRLKEVTGAIAAVPATDLAALVQKGLPFEVECAGGAVTLDPADVVVQLKAPEGWAGAADGATQVLLDGRITPELALEGKARNIVRQVQELRKKADLEMEDRIELFLSSPDEELTLAIAVHAATIGAETLTVRWSKADLGNSGTRAEVKIDGKTLVIALRKAGG